MTFEWFWHVMKLGQLAFGYVEEIVRVGRLHLNTRASGLARAQSLHSFDELHALAFTMDCKRFTVLFGRDLAF